MLLSFKGFKLKKINKRLFLNKENKNLFNSNLIKKNNNELILRLKYKLSNI